MKSTGRTVPARLYFRPVHGVATCFISSSRRRTALTWSQPEKRISSNHWKYKGLAVRGVWGGFSRLSFLRKQLKTKKQTKPKLTSNQTKNHELQFQRQTATWSSLFLSWLLVPQFFFFKAFFVLFCFVWLDFFFVFIFLNYSSFEPHKNGSVAPGSPPEGRKNSLAMYKKRAS